MCLFTSSQWNVKGQLGYTAEVMQKLQNQLITGIYIHTFTYVSVHVLT